MKGLTFHGSLLKISMKFERYSAKNNFQVNFFVTLFSNRFAWCTGFNAYDEREWKKRQRQNIRRSTHSMNFNGESKKRFASNLVGRERRKEEREKRRKRRESGPRDVLGPVVSASLRDVSKSPPCSIRRKKRPLYIVFPPFSLFSKRRFVTLLLCSIRTERFDKIHRRPPRSDSCDGKTNQRQILLCIVGSRRIFPRFTLFSFLIYHLVLSTILVKIRSDTDKECSQ